MKDYHHCGMQHGSDQISHGQADLHATTWELWGLFFLFSGVVRTAELGPCQCRRERGRQLVVGLDGYEGIQSEGSKYYWIIVSHLLGWFVSQLWLCTCQKCPWTKHWTLNSPQWTRQHLAWQQLPIGVWMYVCEWVNEWFWKMLWAPLRGRALYKCSPSANLS